MLRTGMRVGSKDTLKVCAVLWKTQLERSVSPCCRRVGAKGSDFYLTTF